MDDKRKIESEKIREYYKDYLQLVSEKGTPLNPGEVVPSISELANEISASIVLEEPQKEEMLKSLASYLPTDIKRMADEFSVSLSETYKDYTNSLISALSITFAESFSETYQKFSASIAEAEEKTRKQIEELVTSGALEKADQAQKELESLRPFIEDVLANSEEGKGLSFLEFLKFVSPLGEPETDFASKILAAAREQKAAKEIARITTKTLEALDLPLDKINKHIWNMLEGSTTDGQISLNFITTGKTNRKRKQPQQMLVYCAINFDALEGLQITKQLTPFDKRVFIAVNALINNGSDSVTASEIHRAMGNTGSPSSAQIEKICDSLTKMNVGQVFLDNSQEAAQYKNYPLFQYSGPIMPHERISAYINGQLCDTVFHFFRESPIMTFAKGRKQITTIPIKLLDSPISKTDSNLMIDDYLLEEIAHMKNNKTFSRKMLYSTIYQACKIKTSKQKQRAPEKIETYLKHYQKCGHIKGYQLSKDGITIDL